MDSSPPTKFLDIDLKITDIYYHPKEVLVKFQGQYESENDFDYHILQREIQQVSKVKDTIGIGEFCLVEDPHYGEWHRGRIVQKKNHIYEVFLMDSGDILAVRETHIASAVDELFQLPPKMVCGIFANILPDDEKWCPKALNYFLSLRNLNIKGQVQAILPHQTFLLDVPKITSDVVELKLGKLVDGDTFHLIVEMLTELPQEPLYKQMPDLLQQKYTRPDSVFCDARIQPDDQPILSSLQPLLSVGGVEKVKISVAVSPRKFYCQLLRRQLELDELTMRMSSYYETIRRENVPSYDNLGVLCAARQKNGQWHRGVIQQLLTDNKVRIWFMDFGSYEAVPSSCVLKLQPEFVSVTIFSFPCALSCLGEQDETVRGNQLQEFKEALLKQSAVYVHIDLFNSSEHLYYVTLHKCELVNSECLIQGNNVVLRHCTSEIAITGGDIEISGVKPVGPEHVPKDTPQPGKYSDENSILLMGNSATIPFKKAEVKINSICIAYVEYVLNPSEFWIHTNDYVDEFEDLMKNIADVYDSSETYKILEDPEPGKLCCARYSKDMRFYRAFIMEMVDINNCIVYFLDFGNTETVPLFDLRILFPEFQELPALAISCSLANAFPREDVWIKKETEYFKKIVFGQPLTLHVIAQQNDKYIVNVQCLNGSEQGDLLTFMVQAGYAEYWAIKQDPILNIVRGFQVQPSKFKNKNKQCKPLFPNNGVEKPRNSSQNKTLLTVPPIMKESATAFPQCQNVLFSECEKVFSKSDSLRPYKEYWFKPGTVFNVVCYHSASPGDFVCQIQTKLSELNNLMEQIQLYYNTQINQYKQGQLACVVKHLEDGKWYRAAVLKHVSETEVDVVLVDYGSYERVLLKDVQGIIPDFLILECQAIRCCLNIVTESLMFDPDNWTSKACYDFENFISASDRLLTCTVSALIFRSPNHLYYVVDMQSPFVSAQQFLLEHGHAQLYSFELTHSLVPSFSLCSFYYSSFKMKVGKEEEVCITHIHNPSKFYCQLNRNADVIDKLLKKTAEISQMTRCSNQTNTHGLYLAKYFADGLFYRAVTPLGSSNFLPVYFVDFGNKQLVAKDELIPIPDHASEILFIPMQAIKCYLSDLKDTDIPVEISAWFEKNYLGRGLKAVIVAKESDGQLGVELYDNDLQINRKIKEKLLEHMRNCDVDAKDTSKCAGKSVGKQNKVRKVKLGAMKAKVKNEVGRSKIECQSHINPYNHDQVGAGHGKEIRVDLQEQKLLIASEVTEISQNVLHNPTVESEELHANTDNDLTLDFNHMLEGNVTESSVKTVNTLGKERSDTTRKKYTNLPEHSIQPNSKMLAYMSSGTNPSSFSICPVEDENKIVQHMRNCDVDAKDTSKCAEKSVGKQNKVRKVKLGAMKAKVKNEVGRSKIECQSHINPYNHDQVGAGHGKEIRVDLQEQKLLIASEVTEISQNVLHNPTVESEELHANTDNDLTLDFNHMLEGNVIESSVKTVNTLGKERSDTTRKKYTNLPEHSIQPNSKMLAYMSSGTNPSSFSICPVEDENKIVQHMRNCDVDAKDTSKCAEKSVGKQNKVRKVKLGAMKAKVKNEVGRSKIECQSHINPYNHDQVGAGHGKEIKVDLQEQKLLIASEVTEISQNVLHNPTVESEELHANTDNDLTLDFNHMLEGNVIESSVKTVNTLGKERSDTTRKKYTNLPEHSIQPNSKMLAYMSSGTNPSSFSICPVEDENKIVQHMRNCDVDAKDTSKCAEKSVGKQNKVRKVKLGAMKAKVKNEVGRSKIECQSHINPYNHDQVGAGHGKEIRVDLQEQKLLIASEVTEISQNVLHNPTVESEELHANTDNDLTLDFNHMLEGNVIELSVKTVNTLGKERSDTTRKKYVNLPERSIQPNSKMLAYMSSGTNPSSFSICLVEDENKIVQLAELLNGGTVTLDPATDVELEEGDIVLAEYEADCCIYRAVVKRVTSNKLYQVEFIDYGNISTVTASRIYRMEEVFLNFPRLSIRCFLKAKCVVPDNIWSADIDAYFVSKINNQLIICEFLQQYGQEWEVEVFVNGLSMTNELMQKQVHLDSQSVPILNLDKVTKYLPVADIKSGVPNQRSESQNGYEAFEPMSTWESLPKIAHQKIKPGQVEIAEICHISSEGNFYVTLINDLHALSNLHVMAAQEGENSLLILENVKEGSECLTKSKETLQWYRSEVVKLFVDEDNILVFFLDIGKYEIVSLHDTRMLSRKIRQIPRNTVLCKWAWIGSLGELSFESVAEMIKGHEIKILFLRYLQAFIWEVEILVNGILLMEHWKQCFSCKRNLEKWSISGSVTNMDKTKSELSLKLNSVPWTSFQNGKSYPGFVTSVTDPSNFCIQLEDSFKSLKSLFKEISEVPINLPAVPRELIVPGTTCFIKVGSNNEWNRVEVNEVSNLVINLTFIDDGFSAAIPVSEIQKLTVIPEKLVNIPRLTYPCSLFGVLPIDGNKWSDVARLQINEFFSRPGLVFLLKQYHYRTKLEVDVFCGQDSAADVLVASSCAVYSKIASSFGSINRGGIHPLISQILWDPFQIYDKISSSTRMTLMSEKEEEPQKSDLQFKYTCDKILNWKKGWCYKRKGWQEKCFHSNKRKNEKQLGHAYPKGMLSKALRKMHDLQLSIEFDRMKIH